MPVVGNWKGKIEKRIMDMDVGECGYTVPWALTLTLYRDKKKKEVRAFLNRCYPVDPVRKGTAKMFVKRIGPGPDDYLVDISYCGDEEWDISDSPPKKDYFADLGPVPILIEELRDRSNKIIKREIYVDEEYKKVKRDEFLKELVDGAAKVIDEVYRKLKRN